MRELYEKFICDLCGKYGKPVDKVVIKIENRLTGKHPSVIMRGVHIDFPYEKKGEICESCLCDAFQKYLDAK